MPLMFSVGRSGSEGVRTVTRLKFSVLAVALVAATASAVAAIASSNRQQGPRFATVSNTGTVVRGELASIDEETLSSGGGSAPLRILGQRDNLVFYTAAGRSGGVCRALGPLDGHIASLFCPASGSSGFPSDAQPVLDMSGIAWDPSSRSTQVLDLSGFAADGIARVGVIAKDGSLHSTAVVSNLYHTDLPAFTATALVAFDESGAEVYRRPYSG